MHRSLAAVLLLAVAAIGRVACQDVGTACTNPDDTAGECREMRNCPEGLQMLSRAGRHKLKRCGFNGQNEVVCCPQDLNARGKPSARKAVLACESYIKNATAKLQFNIINGVDAEEGEFPHMVALGSESEEAGKTGIEWKCGGTLIAPRHVLTAAHCIITQQAPLTHARMGTNNLLQDTNPHLQDFRIVNDSVHPDYKGNGRTNDVAILVLDKDAKFTEWAQPACLYTEDDLPKVMTISGWGIINTNTNTNSWSALQKANVYESNFTTCKTLYQERINKVIGENQICAADNKNTNIADTCQGDSGGPLQVENIRSSSLFSVVGITSYGMGCASPNPSIYTRVSKYLDFIENFVWPDA